MIPCSQKVYRALQLRRLSRMAFDCPDFAACIPWFTARGWRYEKVRGRLERGRLCLGGAAWLIFYDSRLVISPNTPDPVALTLLVQRASGPPEVPA